ncbi:isocitrate lyase/PEP mutase family protein [Falsihalocynthiibacter arcticus]|uniref:PEP phosphonomutase n=1 Tax=Falsihalocynthiibacter arcticus TaxID=1579316 RepID=A0A126V6B9_9RHOB|nr:isocitrate lyase/phosphoenolpyruvate mutase family protein [Falsihalocynthiibacter arcticus]AML53697.1 PEP phosphonomutase [Falsihalocynthiibacter arcticus]
MTDLGTQFRALHQRGNPFILANAWDIGSAKMLQNLGAQAVATSSAAQAFTLGKPDGVTRDEALTHAQDLVRALDIPVSGDFENGFGDSPDEVAETIRLAGEIGLAGVCIEDIALPSDAPYDLALSAERIKAAASAARALKNDFFLLARADGIMHGVYDLAEALDRIKAFEGAGADGLYIPMPASWDDLATICATTNLPVNALAAGPYAQRRKSEFAAIGVARISLGSALARVTHRAIFDAANTMFTDGDFTPLANGISGDIIDNLLV